jgi:hypothetical protein
MPDAQHHHVEGPTRRSFLKSATATLTGIMLGARATGQPPSPNSYEFINGLWFDGQDFRSRRFYAAGGILTSRRPGKIEAVIDLEGRHVIPPFGEAHNHNVEWSDEETFSRLLRTYLEAGIFYVKNPNNLPRARAPLLGKVNIPTSIDAVFANGGLTASGGHPLGVVTRGIARGGMTEKDGEGASLTIGRTWTASGRRSWPEDPIF